MNHKGAVTTSIRHISNEQDLAIKAIPFSKIGGKDRILWPYIENGVYTVKTRYHVMKNEKGREGI